MDQSLKTLLVVVLCLAFMLVLLFWAIRRREKMWPSMSKNSLLTKTVPILAMIFGLLAGSFFPIFFFGGGAALCFFNILFNRRA